MKNMNRLTCLLLLVFGGQAVAANNELYAHNDQMDKEQNLCPYQPLYRAVDTSLRKTTMTPVEDPLFLSSTYCFGHFDHGRQDQRLLPGYFKDRAAILLQRRYGKAFKALETTEQRVVFVHLFLKTLTHKVLVLPATVRVEPKQIKVILTMDGKSAQNTSLWQMTITPPGYADVHDGLMALKDKPELVEQWPQLVKLVAEVINGNGATTL